MKSFDSRVYSINDLVEWDKAGQLELNPAFQRRPVWSDKAKSYLVDTIVRGKPIPKIFIRQKINVTKRTSIREVVDGQQRLRSILSYIKDGFQLSKRLNPEFGGKFFSEFDEDVQGQILSYEIAVDLLINLPDAEVLDIFNRLNSYAIVLNEQERINATHFGPFKALADKIGFKYNEYWIEQKIFAPRAILRMQEVNLVADLLIAMREGIKSKKQVKPSYARYEKIENDDVGGLEEKFDEVITYIGRIFPEGVQASEFHRVHLFYSLFTAVAHCAFGLPHFAAPRVALALDNQIEKARNGLERVSILFDVEDIARMTPDDMQFMQDARSATTDEVVRERRTKYLLSLMS
jgi:hypothetical protein